MRLDQNPKVAMERALGLLGTLARQRGCAPHVRAACALSDGERLYALRYSSDDQAPSLYHRWSESRQGWAVVSEPLESDEADWTEVPPGSFCTFERGRVEVVPFCPEPLSAAA